MEPLADLLSEIDPKAYAEGKECPYAIPPPVATKPKPKRKRELAVVPTVRKRPALQPQAPPLFNEGDVVWAKWNKQRAEYIGVIRNVMVEEDGYLYAIQYADGDSDAALPQMFVVRCATEEEKSGMATAVASVTTLTCAE